MDDNVINYIAIIIASASAIIAFLQTRESRKQNEESIKQTRLAYLPHIFPRVRNPTSKELFQYTMSNFPEKKLPRPFLLIENVGVGVATDVHLDILDNQNKSLLDKKFEIYAFDPKRVYPFREVNLEIGTQLKIQGYYFDTSGTKHDVEIEFAYPPKILKNKQ